MSTGPVPAPATTGPAPAAAAKQVVPTPAIVSAMVNSGKNISDLILSPHRFPQVEVSGHLTAVEIPGVGMLLPDDTARVAGDLIGQNKLAMTTLREEGSCDVSYSVA